LHLALDRSARIAATIGRQLSVKQEVGMAAFALLAPTAARENRLSDSVAAAICTPRSALRARSRRMIETILESCDRTSREHIPTIVRAGFNLVQETSARVIGVESVHIDPRSGEQDEEAD
jgi:hypothetical protein